MIRKSWLESGPGAQPEGRGCEPFVAVSWQEAETLVAGELDRVRDTYGNSAIFGGSYGWASAGRFHHAQSQIHRFLNSIGGYTYSVNTYSTAAGEVATKRVLGDFREFLATATSWDTIAANSDLVVAFGGIPVKNGQVNGGGVGRHIQREGMIAARRAGVDFVSISPLRSDAMAETDSDWLAPRPGTDPAILLALAHTLFVEGLHDAAFLERYTEGFEKFLPYLLGESDGVAKDAEWATEISELPAETIRQLARRMAQGRTMISVSWSLTRQDHGEQPFWAAITVAAMLGQIGLPGGGIGFGYSAINGNGNDYSGIPGASLPQGRNPVADFIPVARISDMLLNPGDTFDYNGAEYTYPDIHIVYWAGGNPFHHHQDLNRLLKAWQKPDTIIAHEWCWNALAKHADIVLPCTTHLERNDIGMSPRDPYLIYMSKAAEAPGDSRNDYDIFSGLARRLDAEEIFTEGRDEAGWLRWLYDLTRQKAAEVGQELPTLEELQRSGWYKAPPPAEPVVTLKPFRDDPDANPLKTPSSKIEIYSETVATFGYDDCPGHAAWREPAEWLGREDSPYQLHLISNQPSDKLHSQLDHGSVSRNGKLAGREPVVMHPNDAVIRNIKSGDIVKVFNDRGACLAGAVIDDQVRPQVVRMSTGSWFDRSPEANGMCKHGNPNVLTRDQGTSRLAQGPTAHSCLVEIERFNGEVPPVTAFDPPEIITKRKSG